MQESLFEDGKDPQAFRTIGEVSAALDIKPHVLRYWEDQFPMLRPVKRSGGRRYYRPGDVELLQTIDRLLHHDGYTIRGAVKALEEGVPKAGPAVLPLQEDTVDAPDQGAPQENLQPALATSGDNAALHSRLRKVREKLAAALLS